MKIKNRNAAGKKRRFILFRSLLILSIACQASAGGFTPGKTYNKSNVSDIANMLPESILHWITEDQYVMKTGDIKDWVLNPKFLKVSEQNEGKFAIDKNENLIEKSTGHAPTFFLGLPFPKIDPADPQAGTKIMQNVFATRYWNYGTGGTFGTLYWLGRTGGPQRVVQSGVVELYYTNQQRGKIPNPNGDVSQSFNYVTSPMEVSGTNQLAWSFLDNRQDVDFAYLPPLRRVRQVSAASRSDPFLGSEGTVDDVNGYDGKVSAMKWKLLGEKTYLMPTMTDKTATFPVNADGSYTRIFNFPVVVGFQDKGWNGPSYSPISLIWVPRTVYVIQAIPKDPYYNYGKEIYYIDKKLFYIDMKDMYDKAGQYEKTAMFPIEKAVLSNGEPVLACTGLNFYLNWKTKESLVVEVGRGQGAITEDGNIPLSRIGPEYFTVSNLQALSK